MGDEFGLPEETEGSFVGRVGGWRGGISFWLVLGRGGEKLNSMRLIRTEVLNLQPSNILSWVLYYAELKLIKEITYLHTEL